MASRSISKRAQIELKRDVVLREFALDPAKLGLAVDACLAVRDALRERPEFEPAEEFEHLARLLGRTRTEKGTRLALKAVVAKYMGLYATDEKCWTANGATKGAFKDWIKDFKRFMDAWREAWERGEISKEPLRPIRCFGRHAASTSTDFDNPSVAEGVAQSLLALVGSAGTAVPTLQPRSSGPASSGVFPGLESQDRFQNAGCDRPRRIKDADSEEEHHYSGLTHAREHHHAPGLAPPNLPLYKLSSCELPVCVEGGGVHDVCRRSHALMAIGAGEHPPSWVNPAEPNSSGHAPRPDHVDAGVGGMEDDSSFARNGQRSLSTADVVPFRPCEPSSSTRDATPYGPPGGAGAFGLLLQAALNMGVDIGQSEEG